MAQKIIKIGSSAGIIIPKKLLDEHDLKPGDKVYVRIDKDKKVIVQHESELKRFMELYGPALKRLANR